MQVLAGRESTEHDSRNCRVARVCKRLFEGYNREEEKVGEEVEAKEDGGDVDGEEAMEEIGKRMVMMSG